MAAIAEKEVSPSEIKKVSGLPQNVIDSLRERPFAPRKRGGARGRFLKSIEDVEDARQALNERRFKMLATHELTEMTYKEIAEAIEGDEEKAGTVKSNIARAREELKERGKEEFDA